MIEIRIHGRGGQGSVTMAELLAEAAFYSGWQAQAFPSFGVERRGAPIMAFARIDKKFIRLRSQVYDPNFAIVQDATLLSNPSLLSDLKKGATVLVNGNNVDSKKFPVGVKVKNIQATDIAMEIIGRPIINTVMLGAFAKLSGLIKFEAVEKAIMARFEVEIAKKNVLAAKKGFEMIVG